LNKDETSLIFGDIDFSTLKPYVNKINDEMVLMNDDQTLIIDEYKYMHMREYIRLMFNQYPKVEKAKGRATKEAIIDEERINLINNKRLNKNKKDKSVYLPLISSMLNHPGFKYKKNELKDVGDMIGDISEEMKTKTDYMSVMYNEAMNRGWLVLAICWYVMFFQMIGFLVVYFKRVLILMFLIAIFPLVMISYAIDKVGDGKSQARRHRWC
jgi:hypothetical protein